MVDIHQFDGGIIVRCIFEQTESGKCYIQLESDMKLEEKCVEGDREVTYTFSGLETGIYTVTVHGVAVGDRFCSPDGDPDYCTTVTLGHPYPTSVSSHSHSTSETSTRLP